MFLNVNNTVKVMNRWYRNNVPVLPKIIYFFNRVTYACDIRPNPFIHKSVVFPHNALGVVVHHHAKIDQGTKILHQVTIGGSMDKRRMVDGVEIDAPIIGQNVLVGVGATLIGPIIVGDNAIIGAGSIVTKDVPPNSKVYGQAAKIRN